jgi:hypothetical protein
MDLHKRALAFHALFAATAHQLLSLVCFWFCKRAWRLTPACAGPGCPCKNNGSTHLKALSSLRSQALQRQKYKVRA